MESWRHGQLPPTENRKGRRSKNKIQLGLNKERSDNYLFLSSSNNLSEAYFIIFKSKLNKI